MSVIKLDKTHTESVKHLFSDEYIYQIFCNNYLTDLKNYHAYGSIDESGVVKCVIGFYESTDEPAWYLVTHAGSSRSHMRECMDKVISHNESNGRIKFYSRVFKKYENIARNYALSTTNKERYSFVDEYVVSAKTQCKYTLAWNILFGRTLWQDDIIVRCSYLKPEFRIFHNGGGIY